MTLIGDQFVDKLGRYRAYKREVQRVPPPPSNAVSHVADYSGTISTAVVPDSKESKLPLAISQRMVARIVQSSAYALVSLPMAVLWIVLIGAVYGTIFSLLFVGVGFLLLPFALLATGLAGDVERGLINSIMGETIEPPVRQHSSKGLISFALTTMQDASYWRELAFIFLRTILAPLAFGMPLGITVIGWIIAIATDSFFNTLLFAFGSPIVSVLLLLTLTSLQVSMARSLLGLSSRTLNARATVAVQNRDLSVTSAEAERQRIERDLHDGAQARLATVALDLGRAKRRIEREGGDPELTKIIDGAHSDAKEAIIELRNLARGIHPAVLTDRGLDAALSDVAARCTVPVHLDVHMMTRPAAHIESAAYFAVSELLTNITKHSRATQGWVTVRGNHEILRIEVSDNGLGGADHGIGSGLLGLRDRITAIDGTFNVSSPLAGGTAAYIEIPLLGEGSQSF